MLRVIVCSLLLCLVSSFSSFPIAKTSKNRLRYTSLETREVKCYLNMMNEAGRNLKLEVQGGVISYDYVSSPSSTLSSSASSVGIVYLPGLVRQRNEAKSINLQTLCKREDLYFLVSIVKQTNFDLFVCTLRELTTLELVDLQVNSAKEPSDDGLTTQYILLIQY